jgi:hypothetical protein
MSSSSAARVLDPVDAPEATFLDTGVSIVATVPRSERIAPDVTAMHGAEAVSTEQCAHATAAQPDETSGWGSSATWRSSSLPRAATPRPLEVGERTELARCRVSAGERVIYGQRINGCVRITDRPASGTGRSYLVERECEQDGYSALKALVADYVEQSRELDEVPMASSMA